jgi:hypothetical protein
MIYYNLKQMPHHLKFLTSGLFVGFGIGFKCNDYLAGKDSIILPKLITGYSKAKWDLEKQMQESNDYRVKTTFTEKEKLKQFVLPSSGLMLFDKTFQISADKNKTYCIPTDTQVFMEKFFLKDTPDDLKQKALQLKQDLPGLIDELIDKEVETIMK